MLDARYLAPRLSVIDKLYDLMGEDVWFERARSERMAELADVSPALMNRIKSDLTKAGVINVRYTGEKSGKGGRYADWLLTVPRDAAKQKATDYWNGKAEPKPRAEIAPAVQPEPATPTAPSFSADPRDVGYVTVAKSEREETRAIAGPDNGSAFEPLRPMRKSENTALAEAVRQYNSRTSLVETKLRELEALGIHIAASAVKLDKDPVMEAQSALLPYINELEHRCSIYEKTVASLQEQVKGGSELRTQVRSLKAQNERLIAEKVARVS